VHGEGQSKWAKNANFAAACLKGDLTEARSWLGKGAQINTFVGAGETQLHVACRLEPERSLGLVGFLLDNGSDVDPKNRSGYTPLAVCCTYGNAAAARLLLASRADVSSTDSAGGSALGECARKGHREIASLLLTAKASPDAVDRRGRSPLILAAYAGHAEVVALLLGTEGGSGGAVDVDRADSDGWTALLSSCDRGHIEVTGLLLASGAATDKANRHGCTALHRSCLQGRLEVSRLLLDSSADPDPLSHGGFSPISMCCREGHVDAARLLLSCGAAVDRLDGFGWSNLMASSDRGHAAIVRLLVEWRAEVMRRDSQGSSALHLACVKSHLSVVEALLQAGADVDGQAPESASGCGAVANGASDLDTGEEVSARFSRASATPLVLSVQFGSLAVTQRLLAAGAAREQSQLELHASGRGDGGAMLSWLEARAEWSDVRFACEAGVRLWGPSNHLQWPLEFRRAFWALVLVDMRRLNAGKDVVFHVLSLCPWTWFT